MYLGCSSHALLSFVCLIFEYYNFKSDPKTLVSSVVSARNRVILYGGRAGVSQEILDSAALAARPYAALAYEVRRYLTYLMNIEIQRYCAAARILIEKESHNTVVPSDSSSCWWKNTSTLNPQPAGLALI